MGFAHVGSGQLPGGVADLWSSHACPRHARATRACTPASHAYTFPPDHSSLAYTSAPDRSSDSRSTAPDACSLASTPDPRVAGTVIASLAVHTRHRRCGPGAPAVKSIVSGSCFRGSRSLHRCRGAIEVFGPGFRPIAPDKLHRFPQCLSHSWSWRQWVSGPTAVANAAAGRDRVWGDGRTDGRSRPCHRRDQRCDFRPPAPLAARAEERLQARPLGASKTLHLSGKLLVVFAQKGHLSHHIVCPEDHADQ